MGREIEATTVPGLLGVIWNVRVVADHGPAGEVVEDGPLVVVEDRDVDVRVITGLLSEPGIGSPSAAQEPAHSEARQQIPDVRDGFGNTLGRLGIRRDSHTPDTGPCPGAPQVSFVPNPPFGGSARRAIHMPSDQVRSGRSRPRGAANVRLIHAVPAPFRHLPSWGLPWQSRLTPA
jgi:hypothetical protein